MPNCACCSSQMELLALTWLNKLSGIKMSILPNLHRILQVHCSIYYVKLFNLIKDRRVQYESNNNFPAIKQEGFSLSGAKSTYHGPIPARDLFAFSVTGSSEAAFCAVHGPPLGHPQPLHPGAGLGLPPRAHSCARTLPLKPGGSTDLETPPYFMGCPPRFWSADKMPSKEEVLSRAVTERLYGAEGGWAICQLVCNAVTKCCRLVGQQR